MTYFNNNIISEFFNSGFEETITVNGSGVNAIVLQESDIVNFLGLDTSVSKMGFLADTKYPVGTACTVRTKNYDVHYVVEDHGIYTHMLRVGNPVTYVVDDNGNYLTDDNGNYITI